MTDNVIQFPNKNNNTTTELNNATPILDKKNIDIEFLITEVCDNIILTLQENNISVEEITENQLKDLALVIESTKSLVKRYYNQEHFLHNLSDNLFVESPDGVFLSEKIFVDIKMSEEQTNGNS